MRKFLLLVLFLAPAVYAIEPYIAPGNPDIVQMHDEITWEKVCQSYDNFCDVPAGKYQVTLLDRNWEKIDTIRGVVISDSGSTAQPSFDFDDVGSSCYWDQEDWPGGCTAECPGNKSVIGVTSCYGWEVSDEEIPFPNGGMPFERGDLFPTSFRSDRYTATCAAVDPSQIVTEPIKIRIGIICAR